jgi:hypothetical protein
MLPGPLLMFSHFFSLRQHLLAQHLRFPAFQFKGLGGPVKGAPIERINLLI